jgi:translation elongation factor EF-1beta
MGHSVDVGIEMIAKKVNERIYLITVNSDKNPVEVSFSGLKAKKVKVFMENREIEVSEEKLTDYYKPFDVHVYLLIN